MTYTSAQPLLGERAEHPARKMEFSMVEKVSNGVRYVESDADAEEERMGGEGFGNIVMLFVILGALVLVAVIVFAALGLNGQFLNPHLDPPV